MATQGPRYPGTTADSAPGTAWTNLSNVTADDATLAVDGGASTRTAKASNFGFTIPGSATINSILVEMEHHGMSEHTTSTMRLAKAGVAVGDDNGASFDAQWLNGTLGVTSLNDGLWGTTWTSAEINDSGFGVWWQCGNDGSSTSYEVDYVRITVDYTSATGVRMLACSMVGT